MATQTITSNQSGPTLPGSTTPLFIKTQTTFTPDVNGNPIAGTVKNQLLYTPSGSTFFVAAESTEGGAPGSWQLKKYTPAEIFNAGIAQYVQPDGTILGPTAALSLNTGGGVMYQAAQNSIKQSANSAGIPAAYQKNLASSLQNTGSNPKPKIDPSKPTDTGGDDSPIEDASLPAPEIKEGLSKKHFGYWVYPISLGKNDQDYIKFTMMTYGAKSFTIKNGNPTFASSSQIDIGSVFLPIQPSISDMNTVDWQNGTINPLQAGGAMVSIKAQSSGADATLKTAQSLFDSVKDDATKKFLTYYFAGQAVQTNLFSRIAGATVNPNLELLFGGPQLRPFNFTFRLSPRDEDEAKQVRGIIRFFKEGMAVKKAENEMFLKAPNIFRIEFQDGRTGKPKLHNSLPRIKKCALTMCNVDYTPDGSYATFTDSSMTSYNLTLQFSELEPVFSSDYFDEKSQSLPDNVIGY